MNATEQVQGGEGTKKSILVIDDEEGMRALLSHELGLQGYRVVASGDGEKALQEMRRTRFDLVISDIRMPKLGGLETLDEIKRISPETEVIIMTGYASIEAAVQAMKKGAYDFIQKPFNLEEISALAEKAIEKSALKGSLSMYEASKAVFTSVRFEQLLPIIVRLLRETLKAEDAVVMLPGETGALGIIASVGLQKDGEKRARIEMAERAAANPALSGYNAVILADSRGAEAGQGAAENRVSSIVCKLPIEPGVSGIISASRGAGAPEFGLADLRGFTILAAQAAQALRNASLYHKLEEKISELETAKSELVQSEKLAAVGRLTAGIAHELNNPLAGIMGIAELLLRDKTLGEELRQDISDIHQQSLRCRHVIQDLMHFARKSEHRREPVRLLSVLEETLQLFKNDLFRARISVKKLLPADPPLVIGDPNQLKQVFVNILLNAMRSLQGVESPEVSIRLYRAEGLVGVEFRDNGPGIQEKDLPRVFEPFFTTRPVGEGTGLGLSVSYGIIKAHNGDIRVESVAGKGCAFIIELPEGRA